ncbi:MAG: pyridoxamine 5'-phosphate oxidase, partial [Croceimicrobium sp.]
ESDKGKELAENPKASMCFFWPELERQIRIEGLVEKLTETESTAYFNSRPHGSQVGAWVSPQSQVIASRTILEESAKNYSEKYPSQVPKPAHWGGYRLMPQRIEFWQGRASRLHDRVLYVRKEKQWILQRLAP